MLYLLKRAIVLYIPFLFALFLTGVTCAFGNNHFKIEVPEVFTTGGITLYSLPIKIQMPSLAKSDKAQVYAYLTYRGKPISSMKTFIVNSQEQLYHLDLQLTLPKVILSPHIYHYQLHVATKHLSQDTTLPITVYPAFYSIPFGPEKALFRGTRINSIYIFDGFVYLATDHGLAISSDHGVTWRKITTAQGIGSNNINQVFSDKTHLVLATSRGVSISLDQGKTWTNATRQNGLPSNIVYGVYMAHNKIYAATEQGVGFSDNNGVSWHKIKQIHAAASRVYINNRYINVATTNGVFVGPDYGSSWHQSTTADGLGSDVILGLDYIGSNLFAATTQGLSISRDSGKSWRNKTVSNGLGSNIVRDVLATPKTIYAATNNGLSISQDQGQTWKNRTTQNGLSSNICLDADQDNQGNVYVATTNGLDKWGYTYVWPQKH